jgi:hypothetical protein
VSFGRIAGNTKDFIETRGAAPPMVAIAAPEVPAPERRHFGHHHNSRAKTPQRVQTDSSRSIRQRWSTTMHQSRLTNVMIHLLPTAGAASRWRHPARGSCAHPAGVGRFPASLGAEPSSPSEIHPIPPGEGDLQSRSAAVRACLETGRSPVRPTFHRSLLHLKTASGERFGISLGFEMPSEHTETVRVLGVGVPAFALALPDLPVLAFHAIALRRTCTSCRCLRRGGPRICEGPAVDPSSPP